MSSARQTKLVLVVIAIFLFMYGLRPFIGMLPVWVIFQIAGLESDPFWRRLLSAYHLYEASLAKQWGMSVTELRIWIAASQAVALMSLWAAWLLIRFRQSARRAVLVVSVAHLLLLLVSLLTAAVQRREIGVDFDRAFDIVYWICCIAFVSSQTVRQVLTSPVKRQPASGPT
jgi:hypothetical protein